MDWLWGNQREKVLPIRLLFLSWYTPVSSSIRPETGFYVSTKEQSSTISQMDRKHKQNSFIEFLIRFSHLCELIHVFDR